MTPAPRSPCVVIVTRRTPAAGSSSSSAAAASGPAAFDTAQAIAGSVLGRLVLVLSSFSLIHHMVGGLRHFVWDMGKGYEPQTRMNMAKFTLVASVSLTVLVWIVALVLR